MVGVLQESREVVDWKHHIFNSVRICDALTFRCSSTKRRKTSAINFRRISITHLRYRARSTLGRKSWLIYFWLVRSITRNGSSFLIRCNFLNYCLISEPKETYGKQKYKFPSSFWALSHGAGKREHVTRGEHSLHHHVCISYPRQSNEQLLPTRSPDSVRLSSVAEHSSVRRQKDQID